MKPSLESIQDLALSSFLVRLFEEKSFSAPYHYHPELELTYILEGQGKRYVGTHMSDFYAGDFVLLGANVPHCWKSADNPAVGKSRSVVIHFRSDFLGEEFLKKPELKQVVNLLERSDSGIQFLGPYNSHREKMIEILEAENGLKRIILFLDLLHRLSQSENFLLLEKQRHSETLSPGEQERVHNVMAYLVENFKQGVSLPKAASLANMTVPAFCKYFKRHTRKTFVEAITDYRIDFAAQRLIRSNDSISEIASGSGFGDLSHFHRMFKIRLKTSPLNYRKKFLEQKLT